MQLKHIIPAALVVAAASAQNSTNATLVQLIQSNQNLSGLATLLNAYPQVAASFANATNITLFAPDNQALQAVQSVLGSTGGNTNALVSALLSYHAVNGKIYASQISSTPAFPHTNLLDPNYSNVTGGQVIEAVAVGSGASAAVEIISGLKLVANVTQPNLNFTGGVVHVIDNVLSIPSNYATTAQDANLTALLGATNALNLTDTLNNAHGLTIFAPTNTAFQDIASVLSNISTAQAAQVLEYHVVNATAYSSSLANGTVVPTLAGKNLTVTITNGTVFVGGARVINPDVLISGGVIHIIDSVLNPNGTAVANASETAAATLFSGATSGSAVPFTSGVPTPTTTIPALLTTITNPAASYSAKSSASGSKGASSGAGGSSSSSAAGVAVMPTGAVGAAALFGGAALLANL